MTLLRMDRRSVDIHVSRSLLSEAAENALAGTRMVQEAVERAMTHIALGEERAAIHQLGRIGFEMENRLAALMTLTEIAEQADICQAAAAA